jgi:hypothetical protein
MEIWNFGSPRRKCDGVVQFSGMKKEQLEKGVGTCIQGEKNLNERATSEVQSGCPCMHFVVHTRLDQKTSRKHKSRIIC